ncbi:unnamed protein product [Rotaria socialis]
MGCDQTKIRSPVASIHRNSNIERKSVFSYNSDEHHTLSILPEVPPSDLSPIDKDAFTTTVCQQRQKSIDNLVYRETIDKWKPSSIEALVNSIQELSANKNKIDQAWIIFYWISENISYDTDAFFSNQIGTQDAISAFQNRTAVCDGYSSLYAELCNRIGVQCFKVNGYAKGFEFDPRQMSFDEINHAWNIIILEDDHSYFVEPTWGSGYVDKKTHKYKKKLVSDYFLCRPEHMIYRHLPTDPDYQLLTHPITIEQYLMLPYVYPAFFTYDLQIVSPAYSAKVDLVKDESYGLVIIKTPNSTIELSGSLEDEAGNKIEGGHLVYLDKEDQALWRCQFAPPKIGKYNIFIFVGQKSSQDQHSAAAVQFAFDVDHLPLPPISYPHIWSAFFDDNIEIIKPKNSRYIDWPSKANTGYCKILVRSSDKVYVSAGLKDGLTGNNVTNGTLVNFDHETHIWHCLFAPSNTGVPFELTLFARRPNEDKSHSVAEFILRPIPNNALTQSMTFPERYLPFCNAKCLLIEPLNGVLERQSFVHFRCQIPGAQQVNVTVDGEWIEDDPWKPNENDMFDGVIQVGNKEVIIYANFDSKSESYGGLLKYTVS